MECASLIWEEWLLKQYEKSLFPFELNFIAENVEKSKSEVLFWFSRSKFEKLYLGYLPGIRLGIPHDCGTWRCSGYETELHQQSVVHDTDHHHFTFIISELFLDHQNWSLKMEDFQTKSQKSSKVYGQTCRVEVETKPILIPYLLPTQVNKSVWDIGWN